MNLKRGGSKLVNSNRMKVVTNYERASAILNSPYFHIPDLHSFLIGLEQASGEDFSTMKRFVNVSPFFLEGKRHLELRKIALQFLNHKSLSHWRPFINRACEDIVSGLSSSSAFDLVSSVGKPIFKQIARPLLGVSTNNDSQFDEIAFNIQRLIEPMLPLRRLRVFESEFQTLLDSLRESYKNGEKKNIDASLPPSLLDDCLHNNELVLSDAFAFVIAMYAALAPLAQTTVNMIATIYLDNGGKRISRQEFDMRFEAYLHLAAAPRFIHRVAIQNYIDDNFEVAQGETILIDIQSTLKHRHDGVKHHLAFGQGAHFCVGAALSRIVLKKLIPLIMEKYPTLSILEQVVDDENSIAYAYKQLIVSR